MAAVLNNPPIFDRIVRDLQWSPDDDLREPFDLAETIRASYFLAELQTTVKRHHAMQSVATVMHAAAEHMRPRDERGRFTKAQ
jgi:DNA-binding PucR family transcriptional regulator